MVFGGSNPSSPTTFKASVLHRGFFVSVTTGYLLYRMNISITLFGSASILLRISGPEDGFRGFESLFTDHFQSLGFIPGLFCIGHYRISALSYEYQHYVVW